MEDVHRTQRHCPLASVPVLRAAGHEPHPGGAVCCAGGERPAGGAVRGLLWLLRRGEAIEYKF